MSTELREQLFEGARAYLKGETGFQSLYTLALDLAPEVSDDPVARELAGRISAASVETAGRSGAALESFRQTEIQEAVDARA